MKELSLRTMLDVLNKLPEKELDRQVFVSDDTGEIYPVHWLGMGKLAEVRIVDISNHMYSVYDPNLNKFESRPEITEAVVLYCTEQKEKQ